MYPNVRWDSSFNLYPGFAGGAATTGSLLSMDEIGWRAMLQQLDQLYSLQEGWDGEDAEAPDADVLDSARQLMSMLIEKESPPPNRIVPTLEGGIVIEWRGKTRYQEIEIEEPYCGEVMDVQDGAAPEHYEWNWNQLEPETSVALENWPEFNEYALNDGFTTLKATNVG